VDTKEELTLINIKGGAVMESFDVRMAEVLENLADPNAGNAKREITLKVAFAPDKNNPQIINISASCKSNLAPDKDISTVAVLSSNALFELTTPMEQQSILPDNVRPIVLGESTEGGVV